MWFLKYDKNINCNQVAVNVWTTSSTIKPILTWEGQVSSDDAFPVGGTADIWKVGVQYQEGNTSQEAQHPNRHAETTSMVVVIEHAVVVQFHSGCICVALWCNGTKNHNGKYLQVKTKPYKFKFKEIKWKWFNYEEAWVT